MDAASSTVPSQEFADTEAGISTLDESVIMEAEALPSTSTPKKWKPVNCRHFNNYKCWKRTAEFHLKGDENAAECGVEDDEHTDDFLRLLESNANQLELDQFHTLKMHLQFQNAFEKSIIGRKFEKECDRLRSAGFSIPEARMRSLLHCISILEKYIDIPPLPKNLFSAFVDLYFSDH